MRILINGTYWAGSYSLANLVQLLCEQVGSTCIFSTEDYNEFNGMYFDFEIVVAHEYAEKWVQWSDKILTIYREPDEVLREIGLPNYYPKNGVENIDFDLRNLYRPLTYWGFYNQQADYCAKYEQLTRSYLNLALDLCKTLEIKASDKPIKKFFRHDDMKIINSIDFDVLSFERICEKIAKGEHFSLARYGDGEFNAILGKEGENCDGHEYFPQMGKELADTLKSNPPYHLGMHQNAKIEKDTIAWLKANGMKNRKFVSNAVLHCAVRDNLMGKFWDACNNMSDVVIIAPEYVQDQSAIDHPYYYAIPGENTYTSLSKIKEDLTGLDFEDSLVLICASMTAPLIVDYLFRMYGNTATFIDFGSCFDPYVGRNTRSFHKNVVV